MNHMPMRGKIKVDGLIFCVENDIKLSRAQTLLTKEEGTIRWLQKLQPGDVFYDIGANIGCYTLYAARRVGPSGEVYAFEPHVGNAHKLLMNVAANGFNDRVDVLTCALSNPTPMNETGRFLPFAYRSRITGSSGSQLDGSECVFTELKYVTTVDNLLNGWLSRPASPHMVKIDVDGTEPAILCGMMNCLSGSKAEWWGPPPRSIQVEMGPVTEQRVVDALSQVGYSLVERHHTMLGKKQLAAGVPEDQIVHNAVFERIQQ